MISFIPERVIGFTGMRRQDDPLGRIRAASETANYADDIVILGKESAATMREAIEDMMEHPKLPPCSEMNAAVPASRQLPCFGAGSARAHPPAPRVASACQSNRRTHRPSSNRHSRWPVTMRAAGYVGSEMPNRHRSPNLSG